MQGGLSYLGGPQMSPTLPTLSTTVLSIMAGCGIAAVYISFLGALISAATDTYERTFPFLLIMAMLGGAMVLYSTYPTGSP